MRTLSKARQGKKNTHYQLALHWCLALPCIGALPCLEEVIQQVKSLVDSLPTQYALTIAYLLLKLLILEDYITPLFFDTDDSDDPDSVTPRAFF